MFRIELVGLFKRSARLVSDERLTVEAYKAIANELNQKPRLARKTSVVMACRVQSQRRVEVKWNGETTATDARPGDWHVTNLDAGRNPLRDPAGNDNIYVIAAQDFERLYERAVGEAHGQPLFQAKSRIETLRFSGGLDIVAPWKERQTIEDGYLLSNGVDVYGNDKASFESTYQFV